MMVALQDGFSDTTAADDDKLIAVDKSVTYLLTSHFALYLHSEGSLHYPAVSVCQQILIVHIVLLI